MNEPAKLTKSKDVIAYLAEQFPACFSVKGDAKPLKIGIFDDLAKRLDDDPMVSKTRLRTALRHYTNSWRYLHSVKQGKQRVDLDGNEVEPVTEEHQQHAEQSLQESKARVAEKNKARKQEQAEKAPETAEKRQRRASRAKVPAKSSKPTDKKARTSNNKPAPKLNDVELTALSVGQQVQVKAGNQPMPAIVTEIDKDDIQVQLNNGLSMKVKIDNVFVKAQ
ncbi:RNA chaperone ProQ [Idiomarina seosinensis]|uniref:RNA chaperone ProQ n=1 Tax=Idiomarina seosinensis TaxID=281739 RepID=UPI00384ACE90